MLFNRTDRTNRLSKPWKKEEEEQMLYLRDKQNLGWYAIANQIKRTENACRSRYSKLKRGLI